MKKSMFIFIFAKDYIWQCYYLLLGLNIDFKGALDDELNVTCQTWNFFMLKSIYKKMYSL